MKERWQYFLLDANVYLRARNVFKPGMEVEVWWESFKRWEPYLYPGRILESVPLDRPPDGIAE